MGFLCPLSTNAIQCTKGHLASVNALVSVGNYLSNIGSAELGALLCLAFPFSSMAKPVRPKSVDASKNDSYRVADIVSTNDKGQSEKYEVRYVEATPKVYKAWTLVGLLFMSGMILIPVFYAILLANVSLPKENAGMVAIGSMLGSIVMGFISFGIGTIILMVVGFINWWKHG